MKISILAKTSAPDQSFQTVNKCCIAPCRWYTEDPLDSHSVPVGNSHSKVMRHMLMDEEEKIVEESLSIGTTDIRVVVLVVGIEI